MAGSITRLIHKMYVQIQQYAFYSEKTNKTNNTIEKKQLPKEQLGIGGETKTNS